ncbi:hypothetical protein R6Z07F_002578 [Ovis aries]
MRVLQDSEPGGTAPALCSRPRALTTEAKCTGACGPQQERLPQSPRNVQYEKMVEGSQLQEAQAISVLHEMLQQSFNLFHTKRSSAVWDTTLLEQLRTGLHQQLDHLDACLGQVFEDFPVFLAVDPRLVPAKRASRDAAAPSTSKWMWAIENVSASADGRQGAREHRETMRKSAEMDPQTACFSRRARERARRGSIISAFE